MREHPRPERIAPPAPQRPGLQVDVTPDPGWVKTLEETREGKMTKKPRTESARTEQTLAIKVICWSILGPVLAVIFVGVLAGSVKAIEWLIGWVF